MFLAASEFRSGLSLPSQSIVVWAGGSRFGGMRKARIASRSFHSAFRSAKPTVQRADSAAEKLRGLPVPTSVRRIRLRLWDAARSGYQILTLSIPRTVTRRLPPVSHR